MAGEKVEVLVGVDFNLKSVQKELKNIETYYNDASKALSQATAGNTKDLIKSLKSADDLYQSMIDRQRTLADTTGIVGGVKKYETAISNLNLKFNKLHDHTEEINKLELAATISKSQAEKRALNEIISLKKRESEKQLSAIREEENAMKESLKRTQKEVQKVFVEDKKAISKLFKDDIPKSFGDGMGKGMKAAFDKNIEGMVGSVSGVFSKLGGAGIAKFRNVREQRAVKRDLQGLPAKAPNKAMAGLSKGIGGILKVAGPLLAAVGGLAMVVKLLVDADAQAKDFNKTLTNSVPLIRLGRGNLQESVSVMNDLRNAAADWRTNMKLGISAKDHAEVIGALEAHNFGIRKLTDSYQSLYGSNMSAGEVQTSVVSRLTYASKNLGVGMSDVAEFVGKMHDAGGQELSQIYDDLAGIVVMAEKSGTNMKKFFTTVSQFTDQMTLYNYKIENSVALLGAMHKIMDSGSAEKFAKDMTTGFKDMKATDRLTHMMIAHDGDQGAVRKTVQVGIKRALDGLGDKTIDRIRDRLENQGIDTGKDTQSLMIALGKLNEHQRGEIHADLALEDKELATRFSKIATASLKSQGDMLQVSDAMGDLDAFSFMDSQLQKVQFMAGKKGTDIFGVDSTVTSAVGIDEQQLKVLQRVQEANSRNMYLLNQASEAYRLETDEEGKKRAKEAFMMVAENLGMDVFLDDQGKIVDKNNAVISSVGDMLRVMGETEREKILQTPKTQEDFAREQVRATQTVTDVLQYMIYDVLNKIALGISTTVNFLRRTWGNDTTLEGRQREVNHQLLEAEHALASATRKRDQARLDPEKQADVGIYDQQVSAARNALKDANLKKEAFDREHAAILSAAGASPEVIKATSQDSKVMGGKFSTSMFKEGVTFTSEDGEVSRITSKGAKERYEYIKDKVDRGEMSPAAALHHIKDVDGDQVEKGAGDYALTGIKNALPLIRVFGIIEKALSKEDNLQEDALERQKKAEEAALQHYRIIEELQIEGQDAETRRSAALKEVFDTYGIKLDSTTISNLSEKVASEQEKRDFVSKLMGTGKFLKGDAERAFHQRQAGTGYNPNDWPSDQLKELNKLGAVPKAGDARLLTSGIAALNFKAGDMVVDRESLARTVRGRPGEFVPDLLNQAFGGRGGGGGGMTLHNTFNINGGNTAEIERAILSAFEMAERKRYGES